jgi:hypothetical protein
MQDKARDLNAKNARDRKDSQRAFDYSSALLCGPWRSLRLKKDEGQLHCYYHRPLRRTLLLQDAIHQSVSLF